MIPEEHQRILRHRYYNPDTQKVVPKDAPDTAQALRDAADWLDLAYDNSVGAHLRRRADEIEGAS